MKQNELVTVIIPTFKRSEFLERAINSVLMQTYNNIQVIVVDDNNEKSTYREDTAKIMEKFRDDCRVIYLKNKSNLGGALARNEGIKKADGDYITFLDDDDIYLPNKIENQLRYMLENHKEMSFTDIKIMNENNKLIGFKSHKYVKRFTSSDLLAYHLMYHLTPTNTYMYKKDTLLKVGGFEKVRIGQEFMLMLKTIESNVSIGYLPEANVIQYAHHENRISCGENKIKGEDELYKFKCSYFKDLSKKQRKYIQFRHYAVKARAYLEKKDYKMFMIFIFKALVCSPVSVTHEFLNQFSTRLTNYS